MNEHVRFVLEVTVGSVVIVVLFFGAFGLLLQTGVPVEEATYTGQVTDVTVDTGVVFEVDSAEIKTQTTADDGREFCIHDDHADVLEPLQDAQRTGERVTVTYERPFFIGPWDCGAGQPIVTDVEVHRGEQA